MNQPLYYIGIAQAIFASFLIYNKKERGVADRILIAWIIAIGIDMLYSLLNITIWTSLPDLIIAPLFYGPFMYFYTFCIVHKSKRVPKTMHYHLGPIILFGGLTFIFFPQGRGADTLGLLNYAWFSVLFFGQFILYAVSTIIYLGLAIREVKKYKKKFNNYYSSGTGDAPIIWVKDVVYWLVGGFIASLVLYIVFAICNIYPFNPIILYHLGIVLYLYSLTYYGINQNPIISTKVEENELEVNNVEEKAPIQRVYLVGNHYVDMAKRLDALMKFRRLYLDRDLTLQDIATEMGESSATLSNLLNQHLKKNFFTYINEFRVEEVKRRMKSEAYNNYTLMAIASDSGFKSKSSFNTIFKKLTDKTPSQYQRELDCMVEDYDMAVPTLRGLRKIDRREKYRV